MDRIQHLPVLPARVVEVLAEALKAIGAWLLDGTLGGAGHSSLLLETCPDLRVWGTDQDADMLAMAAERLAPFGDRAVTSRARISELDQRFAAGEVPFEGAPAAMLFDVGVASPHLDRPERGFSFQADAPLDMRMDLRREVTAAGIINQWPEGELADLFYQEGGERRSRAIAKRICEARRRAPIVRTATLADLVASAIGGGGKIHPATRVFQALRRAVNDEGPELEAALDAGLDFLGDGGVLAVISFHSGEDRVVKQWMTKQVKAGEFEAITKKPIQATYEETKGNPRARSAKLRAAVRIRSNGGGL